MPNMRMPYDRERVVQPSGGISRTKQEYKDDVNVNLIVARFRATGNMTHLNRREPMYGDFSNPLDLQVQMEQVARAQQEFDTLPASVRQAAKNDPVTYLEMCLSEEGLDVLEAAGLPVEPREESEPRAREASPEPGVVDPQVEENPSGDSE